MATVTKGSSYYYQDSKGGVSQVVGYESKTRRVCRTAFTVDSPCTDLTVKLYASLGNVDYRNCQIYMAVSTSDTAYVGHTGTDGTFLGSWNASGTKTATITGLVMMPGTTYYLWFYHYADAYAWLYVTNGNLTLTASGTPYTTFDVNGLLDGSSANSISGYGTCDVYINGSLASNDCNDYYSNTILVDSTYEVKDIKAITGHTYKGVHSGSTSGTLGIGGASVSLSFTTNYVSRLYHPNKGIVTNTSYTQNEYGWIMSGGTYKFDNLYYGNSHNCYDASTFGLIRPGYSFSGWLLDSNGGNPPYSGVYKIFDETTDYASTEFHKMGDPNTTTATVGADNFVSYLSAQWTPNNYTYTLDASGGTVSHTSINAPYSNGTYALPTPTKTGYNFKGWYADIGVNGPINLGLDYKFDGATGIAVQMDAYMDDWSTLSTATLISCTNGGGWNLWFHDGVLVAEIYDSGIGDYQVINTGLHSNQLRPGWHRFKLVISNNTTLGCSILVDSSQCGGTVILSGGLGYANAQTMTLWLGAESSHTTGAHDGLVFPGYIRHFSIENKYSGVTELSANVFATPCQNITLYADWEPCGTAYVKVDNRWRKGAVTFNNNNAWMPLNNVANQPPDYLVHTPSGASYGFVLNEDGFYESTNNGISNSASVAQVDFYTDGTKKMLVECINYAESNYDFGILSNIGASLTLTSTIDTTNVKKSFKGSQSASIQTVDYGTVAAGNRSFYIKYRKDTSVNSNNDSLQFRIVFYY